MFIKKLGIPGYGISQEKLDIQRACFQLLSPTYIWNTCANAAQTCPHQNS